MRFKIDEDIHPGAAVVLCAQGHDALTEWDQGLRGAPDEDLAKVCKQEDRIFLTLDLDFSDIRAYPPEEYPEIIVLRQQRQDRQSIIRTIHRVLPFLEQGTPSGQLWIVEESQIRIRGRESRDIE